MLPLIPRLVLASGVLIVVSLLFIPPAPETTAGIPALIHLDLVPSPKPGGLSLMVGEIPPNGSAWHELYPAYCTPHVQDDYTDNGDGVVSACDYIKLSGITYHIEWAGPTYYVTCSTTPGGPPLGTNVFEPTGPPQPGNPICQVWHEVWPNYCREIHIDSFHDTDGSGSLTECDYVDNQTNDPTQPPVIFYHIDRIGCDIQIVPVPNTPVRPSTWGHIKSFLGKIIPG